MPAPTADELFQIAIFLASTCAAVFWLSSATGRLLCYLGVVPKKCRQRYGLLIKLSGTQWQPLPLRPLCKGYKFSTTRRSFTSDDAEFCSPD
jgi:hypothetical protein